MLDSDFCQSPEPHAQQLCQFGQDSLDLITLCYQNVDSDEAYIPAHDVELAEPFPPRRDPDRYTSSPSPSPNVNMMNLHLLPAM